MRFLKQLKNIRQRSKNKMSKEVKVGSFAVLALVILYFGFNFLKGQDFLSKENVYYTVFDNSGGLTKGNPILLNGQMVGRVTATEPVKELGYKIKVTMQVSKDIEIGDGTKILLTGELIGGKHLELKLSKNNKVFEGGETLPNYKDKDIMAAMTDKMLPIVESVTKLTNSLNSKIEELDVANLQKETIQSLKAIQLITKDLQSFLNENSQNINDITGDTKKLVAGINATLEKQINPLLTSVKTSADKLNNSDLDKAITDLDKTLKSLNELMTQVNSGQGSLGKLVKDDALYNHLDHMVQTIDSTVNHLDKHPRHFFKPFGTK